VWNIHNGFSGNHKIVLFSFSADIELAKTKQIGISPAVMIAGNPKAGRTIAACAIALVLLIVMSTTFLAKRKRQSPLKVPLHPSSVVLNF
jgi:hypothetical protein